MDRTIEGQYKKMTAKDFDFLEDIVGKENILTEVEALQEFARDMTEDLHFPPIAVVFPSSTKEVSEIVKYCNHKRLPIPARIARSGFSCGSFAVFGSLSNSIKKKDRIVEIDERNFQDTVLPGVISQDF